MRRFVLQGVLLCALALILPACGTTRSAPPAAVSVAPNPGPNPTPDPTPDPVPIPAPDPTPDPVPTDPVIETFPSEGHDHVAVGTIVAYLTDPPTSGNHYPWPQAGYYFETPVMPGFLVHSMEHGGVIIYYNPATVTDAQKDILKTLAHDHPGIFAQVVCVPRDDPAFPIILTAWTHRLRLPSYDQDRIDGFLTLFLGHGPEAVPIPPWNDPTLSNATAISFYTGAPDLTISDTARPGWGSTTTVLTYLAESIALSVDLQVSAASALADTESIQILDSTSAEVLALAVYDASTGLITFSIGPTSFPPVALATGATHAVTFMVDADHNAAWSAGATTTSPVVAFGTPTIRLGLRADFSDGEGAAPTFFFGNIVVSP